FQAEDGIRDDLVTGVQTCALPILFKNCSLLSFVCLQDTPTVLYVKLRQTNESSEQFLNSTASKMVEPGRRQYVNGIGNHRIRSLYGEQSLFNLLEERCGRSLFNWIIASQEPDDDI